jgi:hypothetical protein
MAAPKLAQTLERVKKVCDLTGLYAQLGEPINEDDDCARWEGAHAALCWVLGDLECECGKQFAANVSNCTEIVQTLRKDLNETLGGDGK